MNEAKVKFAVIGCGHIGKRHAEMIRQNRKAELVALIDITSKERLQLEQFKVPFFSSLEAFSQSGLACDVVNIATPNGLYAEQALACLEQKKHVVIEKPITLTKEDAALITAKALQVQKEVFAVMQNRYSPPSLWLKDLLLSGRLGKIFMVQINCYWNRDSRYYKKGKPGMVPGTWLVACSLHSSRTLLISCTGSLVTSATSKEGSTTSIISILPILKTAAHLHLIL